MVKDRMICLCECICTRLLILSIWLHRLATRKAVHVGAADRTSKACTQELSNPRHTESNQA